MLVDGHERGPPQSRWTCESCEKSTPGTEESERGRSVNCLCSICKFCEGIWEAKRWRLLRAAGPPRSSGSSDHLAILSRRQRRIDNGLRSPELPGAHSKPLWQKARWAKFKELQADNRRSFPFVGNGHSRLPHEGRSLLRKGRDGRR